MYEKMPILQTFQESQSALVTLDKGHVNWHALKGFISEYHRTTFQGFIGESVWENVNVWELRCLKDFPSAIVTVTLDEGHTF